MALTPAERAKRYREKLKKNPEKAEEVKKKQLARMKAKRKKVSEMTEEEKVENRNKWKIEKRKQRINKSNNKNPIDGSPKQKAAVSTSLKHRRILRHYNKKNQDKISQLTRQLNAQRKRFYRKQLDSKDIIEKQQKIINKYKAREEFLEYTLRKTYENCEKRVEKEVLKRIVQNCQVGNKTYVAKLMGLTRTTRAKRRRLRVTCYKEIEKFWLRDDVTRFISTYCFK